MSDRMLPEYYWPLLFSGVVGIVGGSAVLASRWYQRVRARQRRFAGGEWKRCPYCWQEYAHCVQQDVRHDGRDIVLVRQYHCLTCDMPSWDVTPVGESAGFPDTRA